MENNSYSMNDFSRGSSINRLKMEIVGKSYLPLHRNNYNILSGSGGVGKSQISLKAMIHYLIDNPLDNALAIYSEDLMDVVEDRVDSIIMGLPISKEEVLERTFFKTLDNDDDKVFISKTAGTNVINYGYLENFIIMCKVNKVGFIILDPLERFHQGLSENDGGDMKDLVVNVFTKIGKMANAVVLVLHHTSKGNVAGARGSTVITNKARVAYNVRKNESIDKSTGLNEVAEGWDNSVMLSVIKDNQFIQRDCKIVMEYGGKLDLPVSYTKPPVEVYEYKEEGFQS